MEHIPIGKFTRTIMALYRYHSGICERLADDTVVIVSLLGITGSAGTMATNGISKIPCRLFTVVRIYPRTPVASSCQGASQEGCRKKKTGEEVDRHDLARNKEVN